MPQPCATPPIVTDSKMNLDTAQRCATLVNLAYDQFGQWVDQGYPEPAKFVWKVNHPPFQLSAPLWGNAVVLDVSNPEPFGFVAFDASDNSVYVAFRGTMTAADQWNDAYYAQVPYTLVTNPDFGKVHGGFYGVYTTPVTNRLGSLENQTNTAISTFNKSRPIKKVYFTGHSLGAALCALAVPDVAYNLELKNIMHYGLYNFGSPRVGDIQFVCSINHKLSSNRLSAVLFRIVNTEDLVPTLPPASDSGAGSFEHLGTPVSFTAQYLTVEGNHSMSDCYSYAIDNPGQPQGPVTPLPNFVIGYADSRKAVPAAARIPAFPG